MNLSKYSKNLILCGDFDYHCIMCKETFHLMADLEKHIRWEKHRNNIKNNAVLPKFTKDSISKIHNYYYCGLCNTVINDMKTVHLHVKNDKHNIFKKNPDSLVKKTIGRYAHDFIELNNGKINIKTWNGLMGKNCVICNLTVDNAANATKHIQMQDHVIKLILCEIIQNEGLYYRKINEDSFQCFKCNQVLTNDLFSEHGKKHNENTNHSTKQPGLTVSNSTWDELDLDGLVITDMHRDIFDIDIKNKKAICKMCQDIVHPARRHFASHIDMHIQTDDKDGKKSGSILMSISKDHGKRRAILAKYGRENYIKLNEGGRMGYCTLCDKLLSPHLCVFVEHVKGSHHTGHLRLKRMENETSPYKTMPLKKYMISLSYCKKLEMFRINTDYLIVIHSFLFLKEIKFGSSKKQLKCFACGDVYPISAMYQHCQTTQHQKNFMAAKFIANNEDIILREIRTNLYHCGLCNEIFPYTKNLEKHLQSHHHIELRYKTNTLRPVIDAQEMYQKLIFESISTHVDCMFSKIIKSVFE